MLALAIVALQGCLTNRAPRTPTTIAGIEPREPEIRVRLIRLEPGESITIGEPGTLTLRSINGTRIGTASGPITVDVTTAGAWLLGGNGVATPIETGLVLDAPGDLFIEGKQHPGWIELRRVPSNSEDGAVEIIAELGLEQYLPGVLIAELPSDWAPATFEAQSVAARGYAIDQRTRARRVGRVWDVTDTVSHQVYAGRATNSTAINAAGNTRGRVLTFEGELLPAYYSAVCGGRNAGPGETWGGQALQTRSAVTPLDARPRPHHCQHAPRYRWTVTRSTEACSKRLAAWGQRAGHELAGVGTIRSIAAERLNAAGRPIRFRVTDTAGGSFSIRAEQLRIALNHAPESVPLERAQRVHSSDIAVGIAGPAITITGQGFGHGVGLCQHGAQAMASNGASLDQILSRYYPGATLARVYD